MKGKTLTYWNYGMAEQYFLDKGFKLVDMKSADEKLHTKQKVAIQDDEGYFYYTAQNNILKNNPLKFAVSNPYTVENIKMWCNSNNKTFTLLSDMYKGNRYLLKWKCLICDEAFEAKWNDIKAGNKCPFCRGLQVGLSNCLATNNPDIASQWHPTKNGGLTPCDVTKGSHKSVWWICKVNSNHIWKAKIFHRTNGRGCPYCFGTYPSSDNNLLVQNPRLCEEWDHNKNKKKPEEYTPNTQSRVWWICKTCNHNWVATIAARNGRDKTGCPKCNKSKGELRIEVFLTYENILYTTQKKYDGLIGLGDGNLSYDFYLPNSNMLVEFQGVQHEKYIRGFHKSKNDFYTQQEHDRRKRNYAKTNNINLLEIWYWDFDNIEEILSKTLQIN